MTGPQEGGYFPKHAAPLWKNNKLLIGGAAAALIVVTVVAIVAASSSSEPDRTDPEETAIAFLERVSTGDPAACELSEKADECRLLIKGPKSGNTPDVEKLVSYTCGNRHTFGAEITPAGKPFARVKLTRNKDTGTWSVHDYDALDSRDSAAKQSQC